MVELLEVVDQIPGETPRPGFTFSLAQ